MDFFTDVIEDKNGGYIVLGSTFIQGNSYDFWLICYNENGDTLWTKTLGTANRDVPKRIVHLPDGDFLLMGNCESENRKELIVIRTDENGNEEWRKVFNDGNSYTGEDIVPLEDNGFVLAGAKGVNGDNANLWMAQMDAKGILVWEKIFESNLSGSFKSIKKLPTGGFAIAAMQAPGPVA